MYTEKSSTLQNCFTENIRIVSIAIDKTMKNTMSIHAAKDEASRFN